MLGSREATVMAEPDYLDLSKEYERLKDDPAWKLEDRARFEHTLWRAVPQDVRRVHNYRIESWFMTRFGVSPTYVRERSDLHNADPLSAALWPLIDKNELIPATAVRLIQEGRRIAAAQAVPPAEGVRQALAAYQALPATRYVKGRLVRQRNPRILPQQGATGRKSQLTKGALWDTLRKSFAAFMRPRMAGIDPIVAERLWTDLEVELNLLIDTFSSKISRTVRGAAPKDDLLARRKLNSALKTLHMGPSSVGKPIDMKKAREQKRVLARAYHPDRHGGDETTRPQYQAVIDAYNLIEEYAASTNERRGR